MRRLSEHWPMGGGPQTPPLSSPRRGACAPVTSLQHLCMLVSASSGLTSKAPSAPDPGAPPHLWAAPPRCLPHSLPLSLSHPNFPARLF